MSSIGIFSRLRLSLRYRVYFGYFRYRRRKWTRQPLRIHWKATDPHLPLQVMITYAADVVCLRRALLSIQQQADATGRLCLVGDSDEAVAEIRRWVSGDADSLQIVHWESLLDSLTPPQQHFIAAWQASQPFGGYARKFAITLALNRDHDFLLSDCDVLWRGDFWQRWKTYPKQRILLGQDPNIAYCPQANQLLAGPDLWQKPPINCGFVYYPQGSLWQAFTDAEYLQLLALTQPAHNHLEQTLIGKAFYRQSGQLLSESDLATTLHDVFTFRDSTQACVRHYAGAKDLFWRDVQHR